MRRPSLAPLGCVVASLAGCGFSPSGASGPDAAVDAPCMPACSAAGDDAITCDPGGNPVHTPCAYGCLDDPGAPVCATSLMPSNVDPALLTRFDFAAVSGGLPFEAGARITIDTDLGAIYKYLPGQLTQGIRVGEGIVNNMGFEKVSSTLSVLGVLELRVVAGSTLEVYGTRSLVILTRLDAIIDGTVRADGGICDREMERPGCNGAGGGRGGGEIGFSALGCAPGGQGAGNPLDTGGGGGGMATAGGSGGTSGTAAGGAPAPLGACAPETLVPLVGGGGGGKAPSGTGGGGGGALQITSYGTLRLGAGAVVTAVGHGGQGTTMFNAGGGGGGAGGAILLEGATVDVATGAVSVAGGGGGGGRLPFNADGQDGRTDGQPALGGAGDGANQTDGLGGNGAINSVAALDGRSNADGTLDGTGGGGGGLGRIRVNSVRGDATAGPKFVGRFSAGRTTRLR